MPGLKIKLPLKFTDQTLPILQNDSVLPAAGALMLIDPTHDLSPWAAGVPADGTILPNLVEAQALALYGAAANDVRPRMIKPAAFTGAAGKVERTGRGGLHGISPQGGNAIVNTGPVVVFPLPLISYVLNNPLHDYYASVWARTTRAPSGAYTGTGFLSLNGMGQQTNSYLFHMGPNGNPALNWNQRPASSDPDAYLGGFETAGASGTGNKYRALATKRWKTVTAGLESSLPGDGTNTAVTSEYAGGGIEFGSSARHDGIGKNGQLTATGAANAGGASAANKDFAPSMIFYRVYLEDLTVSGRTFDQVNALDYAAYTKHVLTPGGRYYGDTFTDPATIA